MQPQKEHKTAIVTVIYNGGKVLCVRKPHSNNTDTSDKWVFPGCIYEKNSSLEDSFKKITKNNVFIGKHLHTYTYQNKKNDITIQVYSCMADTKVELCHHYAELKWVYEEELCSISDWHECYHEVLAKLKPINKHFCSPVRYDLYGMLGDVIDDKCHEQEVLYGAERENTHNVLLGCVYNLAQVEKIARAWIYQVKCEYEAGDSPLNVNSMVLYSPDSGYHMFEIETVTIEDIESPSSCLLSYKIAKKTQDARIASVAADNIQRHTDALPFVLCLH